MVRCLVTNNNIFRNWFICHFANAVFSDYTELYNNYLNDLVPLEKECHIGLQVCNNYKFDRVFG